MTVEMKKNGRLPQTLAPAAVKNVVNPIQNERNPMRRLATRSTLTLYFIAIKGRPGDTMGPSLVFHQLANLCFESLGIYAVVTPELKAKMIIIDSFHIGDLGDVRIWLVENSWVPLPVERVIGAI